jgi:hypothetical protein
MIATTWREAWEHVIPFLAFPTDLRRVVFTTHSIEALHRQIRKTIKTRGHFQPKRPPQTDLLLDPRRAALRTGAVFVLPTSPRPERRTGRSVHSSSTGSNALIFTGERAKVRRASRSRLI